MCFRMELLDNRLSKVPDVQYSDTPKNVFNTYSQLHKYAQIHISTKHF